MTSMKKIKRWDKMVRKYGKEKAEELLKEFKAETSCRLSV